LYCSTEFAQTEFIHQLLQFGFITVRHSFSVSISHRWRPREGARIGCVTLSFEQHFTINIAKLESTSQRECVHGWQNNMVD